MLNRLKNSNWSRYVITLIIGGLLVALGYLIGDSAPNVEAQDGITRVDSIIACKGIVVSDGNPEHGAILLSFLDGDPVLILTDHGDPSKSNIEINLSFKNKAATLNLANRYNDGSYIGLVAGRGETAGVLVTTEKRINDAFNLLVGAKGSGIMLEGDTIQARNRGK
ncbi:MAG: hypothetical protein OXD49_00300 [Candidatus Poribacteria bacterium]|nr:hypothetical protein [Candidatus Poribacteria bacterium]